MRTNVYLIYERNNYGADKLIEICSSEAKAIAYCSSDNRVQIKNKNSYGQTTQIGWKNVLYYVKKKIL